MDFGLDSHQIVPEAVLSDYHPSSNNTVLLQDEDLPE